VEKERAQWNLQEENLGCLEEQLARLEAGHGNKIKPFPPEWEIASTLGEPWPLLYSNVFRVASEATHFSMGAALDTFATMSATPRAAYWSLSDPTQANNAVLYGILTYDAFLAAADAILSTGAASEVTSLILRSRISAIE
jgi:hypothetical protein